MEIATRSLRAWGAVVVSLLVAALPSHAAGPHRPKPRCAHRDDCRLFEAGAAAGVRVGLASSNGSSAHKATLLAEANVVVNHELSWAGIEPERGVWDFTKADDNYRFALDHGLYQIAMHFAWDQQVLDDMPAWVEGITDPAELRAVLAERARVIFARYPAIDRIDVVNEPLLTLGAELYHNHFYDVLGPDYVSELFAIVEAQAPATTELIVNEGGIEYQPEKADALVALVAHLVAAGRRVDAVGLQTHLSVGEPNWEALLSTMQRLAALGVRPFISELDVPVPAAVPDRENVQAERYRQAVEICLMVPACDLVDVWGVADSETWYDWGLYPGLDPLLFDGAYRPKPAYYAVRDALLGGRSRALSLPGPVPVPDGTGDVSFDYAFECRSDSELATLGFDELASVTRIFTAGNPVRLTVPARLTWTPATRTGEAIDYRLDAELDLATAALLHREETGRPAVGLGGYRALVDGVWLSLDATRLAIAYPHPAGTSPAGPGAPSGAGTVTTDAGATTISVAQVAGDSREPANPVRFGAAWRVRASRAARPITLLPVPRLSLDLEVRLGIAFGWFSIDGGAAGHFTCTATGTIPAPATWVRGGRPWPFSRFDTDRCNVAGGGERGASAGAPAAATSRSPSQALSR